VTQLHDAFVGHALERHDSIGCSETRSLGAQSVLNTRIPVWLFTLMELGQPEFCLLYYYYYVLLRHNGGKTEHSSSVGNESVPIQLAQCWFPGLAISSAKI